MQRAETLLLLERVDLDDHSVDLVVELRSAAFPLGDRARDLVDGLVPRRLGVGAKPVLAKPGESFGMALERKPLAVSQPVDPDREVTQGREA